MQNISSKCFGRWEGLDCNLESACLQKVASYRSGCGRIGGTFGGHCLSTCRLCTKDAHGTGLAACLRN